MIELAGLPAQAATYAVQVPSGEATRVPKVLARLRPTSAMLPLAQVGVAAKKMAAASSTRWGAPGHGRSGRDDLLGGRRMHPAGGLCHVLRPLRRCSVLFQGLSSPALKDNDAVEEARRWLFRRAATVPACCALHPTRAPAPQCNGEATERQYAHAHPPVLASVLPSSRPSAASSISWNM